MNRGYFITFEGGEGAGKSTLMDGLARVLREQGYFVVTTREPGGTPLGETIRRLLLNHDPAVLIGSQAELMLFLAARAQHIEELIAPALKKGGIVLCDRFNDSTIAYQAVGRGLNADAVDHLCRLVCGVNLPDLTLFLDVDPNVGLKRTQKRSGSVSDRIESEKLDFHMRVREAFLTLAKQESQRIHRIDANQERAVVFQEALQKVEESLKRR